MATARPKPYHHGDLRRALIAAGIETLAEDGAAALDLRKVARRAGVSHAAPYRHFEDKRALIAAIAEEGFVRLADELREAVSQAALDGQLLACAQAYVNFALTEPSLMREMFSGLTIDRMAYESLHDASKVSFTILYEIVARQQLAGRFIQEPPDKQVLVIWSMFHGLAMLLLENQMPMIYNDPEGVEGLLRRTVTILCEGLIPRKE